MYPKMKNKNIVYTYEKYIATFLSLNFIFSNFANNLTIQRDTANSFVWLVWFGLIHYSAFSAAKAM